MRVPVELLNPMQRDRVVRVPDALVDTDATRTVISRALADQLGLEIVGTQQIRTADGTSQVDQAYGLVRFDGRQTFGDIWVSDTYAGVLIGVVTLESLGLAVDPVSGRLVNAEFLLL